MDGRQYSRYPGKHFHTESLARGDLAHIPLNTRGNMIFGQEWKYFVYLVTTFCRQQFAPSTISASGYANNLWSLLLTLDILRSNITAVKLLQTPNEASTNSEWSVNTKHFMSTAIEIQQMIWQIYISKKVQNSQRFTACDKSLLDNKEKPGYIFQCVLHV